MLARRDTRREASRLRPLSPLQTLEDQSRTWGIRCHSCTGREGLPPSWKLSYKTYVLRFTRESRFSFNQRIARILMCMLKDLTLPNCHGLRMPRSRNMPILKATSGPFCSRFDPHKTTMEDHTATDRSVDIEGRGCKAVSGNCWR